MNYSFNRCTDFLRRYGYPLLLLAFIWCIFSADFSIETILLATLMASLILILLCKYWGRPRLTFHLRDSLGLLLFIVRQLISSSFQVGKEILSSKIYSQPKIIRVQHHCQHDFQLFILTSMISLTPGSLFIDLSSRKDELVLHVMFAEEPDALARFIEHEIECRVLKAFRYGH